MSLSTKYSVGGARMSTLRLELVAWGFLLRFASIHVARWTMLGSTYLLHWLSITPMFRLYLPCPSWPAPYRMRRQAGDGFVVQFLPS